MNDLLSTKRSSEYTTEFTALFCGCDSECVREWFLRILEEQSKQFLSFPPDFVLERVMNFRPNYLERMQKFFQGFNCLASLQLFRQSLEGAYVQPLTFCIIPKRSLEHPQGLVYVAKAALSGCEVFLVFRNDFSFFWSCHHERPTLNREIFRNYHKAHNPVPRSRVCAYVRGSCGSLNSLQKQYFAFFLLFWSYILWHFCTCLHLEGCRSSGRSIVSSYKTVFVIRTV